MPKPNNTEKMISEYMSSNPEGGPLHIILADMNIESCFLVSCKKDCQKAGDVIGEKICDDLMSLTKGQRKHLIRKYA